MTNEERLKVVIDNLRLIERTRLLCNTRTELERMVGFTISGNGQLNTSAPLFLKNIHFVYGGESEANGFICLSKEPNEAIKGIVGDGTKDYYNIVCSADTAALTLYNCFIDGLNTRLLYDNDMKYCLEGLTILDTKIRTHYTADSKGKDSPFIQFKKGGVKDTRFENSTVWNTGDANCQYFIQYENGARIDRFGYDKDSEHTTVSFISSTFWNIAAGNWCNYTGFQNFSIYTITRCIWVDSGGAGEIARRLLGNGRLGSACEATFLYNTYWTNGEAKDQSSYDQTETALTTDPAFVDAAAGNFTPTGADQLRFRTGDPRWLP